MHQSFPTTTLKQFEDPQRVSLSFVFLVFWSLPCGLWLKKPQLVNIRGCSPPNLMVPSTQNHPSEYTGFVHPVFPWGGGGFPSREDFFSTLRFGAQRPGQGLHGQGAQGRHRQLRGEDPAAQGHLRAPRAACRAPNEGRGGAPLAVIFLFGVWGDQVFFLLQLFALFSLSLALTRAGGVPLSL